MQNLREQNPREITKEKLLQSDTSFRRLTREHQALEKKLQKIDKLGYSTPEIEAERKKIQVLKLRAKDEMEKILREKMERRKSAA